MCNLNDKEMKKTLREELEQMLKDLIGRKDMLNKNIDEYKQVGNFIDAGLNQVKRDTLTLVVTRIEEILK